MFHSSISFTKKKKNVSDPDDNTRNFKTMHGSRNRAQQYGGERTLLYKKET